MSNLFISHSSQDNEAARELEARLAEKEHESVFLDLDPEKGIQTGESWEQTLYRKLRACRAVIALVSDTYLKSQWCFAEVALARMEGKELFVFQIDPWTDETAMPSILTEEQFIDLRAGKDKDEGYRRLWNGFQVKGIVPEQHRKWGPDEPPYPGLRAFEEADEPIFFGRDGEVREGMELLNQVRRQGQPRMVMVLGSSGSGKSSLTRAGILPRLRKDRDRWRVVGPIRPGRAPARELAAALAAAFEAAGEPRSQENLLALLDPLSATEPSPPAAAGEPPRGEAISDREARRRLLEALEAAEGGLGAADHEVIDSVRRLKAYLGAPADETGASAGAAAPPAAPRAAGRDRLGELTTQLRLAGEGARESTVVLVIDQFEELLGREEQGAEDPANRFLALLREALLSEDDPPLVLGTMRSDFLGLLQRSLPLQEVDFKSLSVGPMARTGMFDVVTRPAALGGLKLDDNFADRILNDAETSDALPLLAFTLSTLWDLHHDGGWLRVEHYEALGGIQGAIAQVADETLEAALKLGDERTLRRAFLSLARQTEEGTGWTRRPKAWDQLKPEAQAMLERFVDNRLLVRRGDGGGEGSVEVAHEALFRSWETLSGWLDENAEAFRLLRDIEAGAGAWKATASDRQKADYLFRGGRLARARELADAGVLELEPRDSAFIDASYAAEQAAIEAERERQRRELRRTRFFLAAVSVAFVGALILAWLAWQQSIRARDQALVAVAADWLGRDPTRAALTLLELRQPKRAPRSVSLMSEAMTRRLARVELAGHAGPLASAVFGTRRKNGALEEHGTDARNTDEGQLLVLTASRDQTARIWSAESVGEPLVLPHADEVLSAVFHPDGDRVAASLLDGSTWLWTAEALAKVQAAGQLGDNAPDLESEAAPKRLEQGGEIHTAAFSDDGELLVTASDNGTVRLWTADGVSIQRQGENVMLDLAAGKSIQANAAVFEPGSHRVLIATNDGAIHRWSPAMGGELAPVEPDSEELVTLVPVPEDPDVKPVRRVAFDPRGEHFVTASFDRTARLWNADGSPAPDADNQIVLRHEAPVYEAVFDASGERILTASDDGTVRIWNIDGSPAREPGGGEIVLRHSNGVTSVRMSPDGGSILTACKDGTARIWSVASRGEPLLLASQGDQRWVNSVAFGPRGERIVTVGDNGVPRLWDAASGLPLDQAEDREGDAGAVWSASSTALWSGGLMAGHGTDQPVRTYVSPGGDLFLTASEAGDARLWTADARPVVDAEGSAIVLQHEGRINRGAFGSDGQLLLVTASEDGTARVWRRDGERVATLDHGGQAVNSAAFHPSGRRVVTASKDKLARVWLLPAAGAEGATLTKPELTLEHKAEVYDAAFDPKGRRIATSWGLRASIWPAAGGDPIASFEGHEDKVKSVAFDPAGLRIVTTSTDRTARVWIAAGDADPLVLRGHEYTLVEKAVFSPDGERLVSVSWDPDARLWRTTYHGLGAAIHDVAPGVCLPPAFRVNSLGEKRGKAAKRFRTCRRCLGAASWGGFRDCFVPSFP